WTLGGEIGWQMRFDKRFGPATRLLVATEGILTTRLQQDPLLSEFATVVLDEFHERSIHSDLGLALAQQARQARDDLRIVVMSATIDPAPIAAYLGDCPVVRTSGRTFPVEVRHAPATSVADGAQELLSRTSGNILCFVAGAADVTRI